MITESKYKSKLWSKTTKSFNIDTLEDLRQLKEKYPSVSMYKFKDACLSFRTLAEIKKECEGKTVKMQDGRVLSEYDYHKEKRHIVKLANDHIFKCEPLRGYSNTYKIEWITRKYRITVTCKINLWQTVTVRHERDKDKYAQYTVRAVKLIPLYPETLTKEIHFNIITWFGGSMTTYNTDKEDRYVETFDHNLFYGLMWSK